MNYNDLNTIINSNQKNIDKLTDYSLGFVSPLPHLAFEKAVKFAFEMFEFKIHLVNKIHMNKHMKT